MKRSRTLVAGAGGFLARHLLRRLAQDPACELVTVGRTPPGLPGGIRHHTLDCGDCDRLKEVVRSEAPDRIVSLAGSSGPGFGEMLRYNVGVAGAILAAASERPGETPVRIVLAGSAAEFGLPSELPVTEAAELLPRSEYGLAKSLQTRLAEYHRRVSGGRLRVSVAHFFNLIGPGSPARLVFGSFVEQIAGSAPGGALRVGNLETERDFVHVADAAEALVAILSLAEPAPSYVVSSGRPVRIRDLLEHLVRVSGREVRVETDAARASAFDVPRIYGDSSRLTRETGWTPRRTPEAAVEEMWEESA